MNSPFLFVFEMSDRETKAGFRFWFWFCSREKGNCYREQQRAPK